MPADGKARCLALVSDAFGGRGGIAQYNRDLLTAFAVSGWVASICVLPRQAPDPAFPPEGIRQAAPRGRAGYAIAALVRGLTKPVDVVFCGHIHLAPLGALIARARGAKLVVQTHGIEVWSRPTRARRAAMEKSDLILCVSRHTRRTVLDQAAVTPESVLVVSNTVGDAFTPGDDSGIRQSLGLHDKQVLLTVGRLDSRERYKGQDRVIAAMPTLIAQGHDLIYLIAGGGDDRSRLQDLAREAGLADRVRFLGQLRPEQLVEVYRAADLFVMASTGEGFGISFLEAMACGTPALGLAAGGARDALADGALGTIVEDGDLCESIGRLLRSPKPDRQALAAEVRARFGRQLFQDCVKAVLGRLRNAPDARRPDPDAAILVSR
jgi:phosphatidylinositol alpha-1,6-mannosyltransferase